MKRFQNVILVLWALLLILFYAFNWEYAWRPQRFDFLFMELQMRLVFWLGIGGFAIALVVRLLGGVETSGVKRRSSQSLDQLSARLHETRSRELEELVERVETRFKSMLSLDSPSQQEAGEEKNGKNQDKDIKSKEKKKGRLFKSAKKKTPLADSANASSSDSSSAEQ